MRLAYTKSTLDHPVLVLNKSWIPIHVTSVRRALCLVFAEAAVVIETNTLQTFAFDDWCAWEDSPTDRWLRTPDRLVAAPEVVQLRGYNRVPAHDAPFSRRNLFERDQHTCQYCGTRSARPDRMSIDHVKPRSKGGSTSWNNCVLACLRCNSQKADRSLHESGLRLRRAPKPPRWTPYLNLGSTELLESWSQFTSSRKNN